MSQTLLKNLFKWAEETSQFNEDFINILNKLYDTGYFIEADVHYLKNCMNFRMIHIFYLKEWKLKKFKNL